LAGLLIATAAAEPPRLGQPTPPPPPAPIAPILTGPAILGPGRIPGHRLESAGGRPREYLLVGLRRLHGASRRRSPAVRSGMSGPEDWPGPWMSWRRSRDLSDPGPRRQRGSGFLPVEVRGL